MDDDTQRPSAALLPHPVPLQGGLFPLFGGDGLITLRQGLTVLVGPNGTGKTQALRAVARHLRNLTAEFDEEKRQPKIEVRLGRPWIVRLVSAGRMAPLEGYRSDISGTGFQNEAVPATVARSQDHVPLHAYESVVGDILALHERPDLRIKVIARLGALLERKVKLTPTTRGIKIDFVSDETSYLANTEASGVLHLVSLLAALHDNEVGAVLIDEPELSLHPQWQAFLLDEARAVSGDPGRDPTKKIVVLSTHAEAMLPLRGITDLPDIVFCSDMQESPKHVPHPVLWTIGCVKRRA